MGISQGTASPNDTLSLTPLGEASSRLDLAVIHEMLEDIGYKDDEGIANDVIPFLFSFLQFYLQKLMPACRTLSCWDKTR